MLKTSCGPLAWRGGRRANDEYLEWKVTSSTGPQGGDVFSQKVEQIQHKKGVTQSYSSVPQYA